MKSLSYLSNAFIISATIVLVGNVLNGGLSTLAAAIMGFAATSAPAMQTVLLYWLSGVLFVLGVGLAVISIILERRNR